MHKEELTEIAAKLVAPGKGILAADESNKTAAKRLASIGVPDSEENRRLYRQLFFNAPNVEKYLSGVILYDETIRQQNDEGVSFVGFLKERGIVPGIKVDLGLQDIPNFPGEQVSRGLDDLSERLHEYYALGARFAKWRSVIAIGEETPTDACIEANAFVLAQYALLCQEAGIVPIIEPEVLLDGDHSIEKAEEVTTKVLHTVFEAIKKYRVQLDGLILKSSMVLSGKDAENRASSAEVAEATVRTFKNTVPEELQGIVFLSGGQSAKEATDNLNAIGALGEQPWALTFCYARALQGSALQVWEGDAKKVTAAQSVFIQRLEETVAATKGEYTPG